MRTVTKKPVSSLGHGAPAEAEQSNNLSSCFGSYPVNQCLFGGLVGVTFVAFLGFWLVILLFKVPPAQRGHDLPDGKNCLCYLNFVQARVTVVRSSVLMSRQCTVDPGVAGEVMPPAVKIHV